MKLTDEFDPIRHWAAAKGILTGGDPKTQLVKLTEETGELAHAILRKNKIAVQDAIGDCVVVLTSIAFFHGITIEECINAAFNEIANRTGQMDEGNFLKETAQL